MLIILPNSTRTAKDANTACSLQYKPVQAALLLHKTLTTLLDFQWRLVTIKPTLGNNSPQCHSTFATTLRDFFQLAAWYWKLPPSTKADFGSFPMPIGHPVSFTDPNGCLNARAILTLLEIITSQNIPAPCFYIYPSVISWIILSRTSDTLILFFVLRLRFVGFRCVAIE